MYPFWRYRLELRDNNDKTGSASIALPVLRESELGAFRASLTPLTDAVVDAARIYSYRQWPSLEGSSALTLIICAVRCLTRMGEEDFLWRLLIASHYAPEFGAWTVWEDGIPNWIMEFVNGYLNAIGIQQAFNWRVQAVGVVELAYV